MRMLLNQFDLKPQVQPERFAQAWAQFSDALIAADLAAEVTPLMTRARPSGYDTDDERPHTHLAFIYFRDAAQADAAWQAIETDAAAIGPSHRKVIGLVTNAVFTFWGDST